MIRSSLTCFIASFICSLATVHAEESSWRGVFGWQGSTAFITTSDLTTIDLQFPDPNEINASVIFPSPGNEIVVRGTAIASTIVKVAEYQLVPKLLPTVRGTRRALIVLARFSNTPPLSNDTQAKAEIASVVAPQLRSFFEEISFGNVSINFETAGVITVDGNAPECTGITPFEIKDRILTAAQQAGLDLSAYDHLLLWAENATDCRAFAYGDRMSVYYSPFSNVTRFTKVASHEVGHNFGWLHANDLECERNSHGIYRPMEGECFSVEYGDSFDLMGGGLLAHPNVWEKHIVGWVPKENILDVSSSGVYEIASLESLGELPIALRIEHGLISGENFNRNVLSPAQFDLWFEFREPRGFDINAFFANFLAAHAVRRYPLSSGPGESMLVSEGPDERTIKYGYGVGDAFVDPQTGVRVTPLLLRPGGSSNAASRMLIDVRFPGSEGGASPQFKKLNKKLTLKIKKRVKVALLAAGQPIQKCVIEPTLPGNLKFSEADCSISGKTGKRAMTQKAYSVVAWNQSGSASMNLRVKIAAK